MCVAIAIACLICLKQLYTIIIIQTRSIFFLMILESFRTNLFGT